MKFKYICGGKSFFTETEAFEYANKVFTKENIILGIAKVEETDEERVNLIDAVLHQIKIDVENGEFDAILELFNLIPSKNLYNFLSDEIREEMQNA